MQQIPAHFPPWRVRKSLRFRSRETFYSEGERRDDQKLRKILRIKLWRYFTVQEEVRFQGRSQDFLSGEGWGA